MLREQLVYRNPKDFRVCGGQAVWRDSAIEHRNQKYAASAGLPRLRILGFRHSHASVLINEGIFIQEIARRLGRARVETTWGGLCSSLSARRGTRDSHFRPHSIIFLHFFAEKRKPPKYRGFSAFWWRRRESNPCPRGPCDSFLRAQSVF